MAFFNGAFFGSQGRLRLCLIAAAIALVYPGWSMILRTPTRSVLESGDGDTVVLLASRYNHSTLEGWNPKSGEHWVIADGLFRGTKPFRRGWVTWLPNENGLAWIDRSGDAYRLHLVPSDDPSALQTWEVKGLNSGWVTVLALMHQRRFAVLQAFERKGWHTYPRELLVVDLESGQILPNDSDDLKWVYFDHESGLFTRNRYDGARFCTLSSLGEWEDIDPPSPEPKLKPDEFNVAVSTKGKVRVLSDGDLPSRDEEDVLLYVDGLSPQERWYVATNRDGDSFTYFGVPNTNQIWRHDFHGMRLSQMEFQSQDRGLAYVDDSGDVQWFDLDERKVTHVGLFGSTARLVRLSLALLTLCIPLAILSFRESHLKWAIGDAICVSLLLEGAAFSVSQAREARADLELDSYPSLQVVLSQLDGMQNCFLCAMVISVALYWALGNGSFGKRLLCGLGCLALASIPQWIDNRFLPDRDYIDFLRGHGHGGAFPDDSTIFSVAAPFIALILLAGLLPIRLVRWRLAVPGLIDVSQEMHVGRFGLKSLLAVVMAVALLMPSVLRIVEIDDWPRVLLRLGFGFAIPIGAGVCLAIMLFSRSRWTVVGAAALLIVVLVVGPKPDEMSYTMDWYCVTEAKWRAALPLVATVCFPFWLARRRGFRWTREA